MLVSLPNLPQPPSDGGQVPGYLARLYSNLLNILTSYARAINSNAYLPLSTVADLPADAQEGQWALVTDESGGAVPAFFDGAVWRRVTDRAVVS